MTFDYELTLIDLNYQENEIGDVITDESRTVIWCDKKSVTRSEHYAAAANGLRPEIVFVINQFEYGGQKQIEFEGVKYKVIRTYQTSDSKNIGSFETIEMVCQGEVNDGK
ncbi:phage head closure protein [Neobacillus sp. MM2021_6]|uniref:phage head closure protein n=1 Tax=Bacillaceae TaxID=186817 RepID=UPI00140AD917|nr:phage head closure protein [Neobacillus sp. MM2021_6]NHC21287.1 phage head closure protein [Bacillus sp. MM2020_4]